MNTKNYSLPYNPIERRAGLQNSNYSATGRLSRRRGTTRRRRADRKRFGGIFGTSVNDMFILKTFMALFLGMFALCVILCAMPVVESEKARHHMKHDAVPSHRMKHISVPSHHMKHNDVPSITPVNIENKNEHEVKEEKFDLLSKDITKEMNESQKLNSSSFPYFGTSKVDSKHYNPLGASRFSEWKDGDTPFVISSDMKRKSDSLARERRSAVKAAMQHAWNSYHKHAFGYDEVQPVTGTGNYNWGGLGTTLVDSLDTLWLMGMKKEFFEARDWVRDSLSHDRDEFISTFENTIRSLGGLLAAFDWSGDNAFLEKATDLGDRLVKAFDTPTGIPWNEVNLRTGAGRNEVWSPRETQISSAGSLQIEFRYLSKATGNKIYAEKAEHAFDALHSLKPPKGLYYTAVKNTGDRPHFGVMAARLTFGGRADSFYEYMLKLWLQGGKTESKYREMYDEAIEGMHDVLLQYSSPSGLAYLVKKNKLRTKVLIHEFEHLECFMGGLLALGAHNDPLGPDSPRAKRDMKTAKAITYTCYQMYAVTPTGLGAEISFDFQPRVGHEKDYDLKPKDDAKHYLLRPEVVESFFVLNKITGDPIYREWGWEIFQSIEKYCKTKYGYGAFPDVRDVNRKPNDRMESFFLGETLKYLYLLFDPDSEVDLEKYVFNTEAHALRNFVS